MQFEEGMKKIHAMAGHSQEQFDEIRQGILNMASDETIWVSDSDVCPMCNGLLDWMGECPHCGWDSSYPEPPYYEDGEDPFDGPIIGTPEEAYTVELSLSDAEIERMIEDEA